MQNPTRKIMVAYFALFSLNQAQAGSVIEQQLAHYRAQGAVQANPADGQTLWYRASEGRSCTSCHGETPVDPGRHAKTGKAIKPMALSVNPERYTDSKKIEKWFLRNCKWTYGRACSAQEKSNILSWLANQ